MSKKIGRPRKFDEKTEPFSIRIPVSAIKAIPRPKMAWARAVVLREIENLTNKDH